MEIPALIMMILIQGSITCITAYFFYKVLTSKPKSKPDSYLNNDNEES